LSRMISSQCTNASQATFYSQNTSRQTFDKSLKDRNSSRHHNAMS
jgi:hypothetical protein